MLDHCIRIENMDCRNQSDCDEDEYCVLSGYPVPDPENPPEPGVYRGNEGMRAFCRANSGGFDAEPTKDSSDSGPLPGVRTDPLVEHLNQLRGERGP